MLCPNCKKEIPENVSHCPECGAAVNVAIKKPKKSIVKKWWFWVIIVVVLIAVIGAIGGGDNDDSTPSDDVVAEQTSDSETTAATSETTTASDNKYYVGDTVNDGDVIINYASAEEWTGYEDYFAPKSGNKIIRIKVDITNNSSSDYFISSFYCYADNQSVESYYYGDDTFSTYTISSGRNTSGYVYFEVPENAETIEIEYETNYWSDEKAIFVVEF